MILFLLSNLFFAYVNSQQCGEISIASGLIVNGYQALRGEFPFLVGFFKYENGKFFCAGNLLTNKHVLSAAHCFREKHRQHSVDADDIYAKLGKYDLGKSHERGSVTRDIKMLIIHEDWKRHTSSYDADISLVVLEKEVGFTEFIKPICLLSREWSRKNSLKGGYVMGWGASENTDFIRAENITRKVEMSAPVTNEQCFLKFKELVDLSSTRTFCAGAKEKGPCNGDSGGAFAIFLNNKWYLQGIVSASVLNADRHCDLTRFSVYTNVYHYIDWIVEKVSEQTRTSRCNNNAPDSTFPYCCKNGAKNDYCCLGPHINPTCSAPTQPPKICTNGAPISTYPFCCKNRARNAFCCESAYINPTCAPPGNLINKIPSECYQKTVIGKGGYAILGGPCQITLEGKNECYEWLHQVNPEGTCNSYKFDTVSDLYVGIQHVRKDTFFNIYKLKSINGEGSATQEISSNSAGNVQINIGFEGDQDGFTSYKESITNSYNLQVNIIECNRTQTDDVQAKNGNIRILKCMDLNHMYAFSHDAGEIFYKFLVDCVHDKRKIFIQNGKIIFEICLLPPPK